MGGRLLVFFVRLYGQPYILFAIVSHNLFLLYSRHSQQHHHFTSLLCLLPTMPHDTRLFLELGGGGDPKKRKVTLKGGDPVFLACDWLTGWS